MKNLKLLFVFIALSLGCRQDKEEAIPVNDELSGNHAKVYYDAIIMIQPDYITSLPHFSPKQRDEYINNYWQNQGEKKWSAISVEDLTDLYDESTPRNANKVVLQVTNIENPKKVKTLWMPYDESFIKNVEKTGNPINSSFYIVDRKYFDGRNTYKGIPSGMRYATENGLMVNAVTARFGKSKNIEMNKDPYCVIFQATFIHFFYEDNGIGNDAGNPGIKIPIN